MGNNEYPPSEKMKRDLNCFLASGETLTDLLNKKSITMEAKRKQTPEEIIEDFIRNDASKFPNATEEEMLYRFRNHILFIEEERQSTPAPYPSDEIIMGILKKWYGRPVKAEELELLINFRNTYFPNQRDELISDFTSQEIRDEMDTDMVDGCMPVGEIESCLSHWHNKYLITKRDSAPQRQDEKTKGGNYTHEMNRPMDI